MEINTEVKRRSNSSMMVLVVEGAAAEADV